MLQKLNERIQGVVAWVIVVIIAVTFTLFGVDSYMQARQAAPSTVVEVNGKPISKELYQTTYERLRRTRDNTTLTAVAEKQLKQQLLDNLIVSQLSTESARSYGFEVTPQQIDQTILTIPQFQDKGQFSADRYKQTLSAALFTNESFHNEVSKGLLMNQQRFAFLDTAFVLTNEVAQYVKYQGQTRNYRYVLIDPELFVNAVPVSSEEVSTYYENHPHMFLAPEQVSLEVARLSMADIKAKIQVSDDEIKRYYEENRASFGANPKTRKPFNAVKQAIAEQLLAERAQAEFASSLEILADLSYQSPDSIKPVTDKLGLPMENTPRFTRSGGDSPLLHHAQVLQAAFSREVMVLGNNSAPIQLDNENVVVVRVHEHLPAIKKPLVEVEPLARAQVTREKAQAKAIQVGEALLHASNAEERALLMQTHHLDWKVIESAGRKAEHVPSSINKLAFSIPRTSGSIGGRALPKNGYIFVQIQQVNDGKADPKADDKKRMISELQANHGLKDYDLYISQLLREATIVRN
jgi:peptidyl-prolyl cis-trans isomerase D